MVEHLKNTEINARRISNVEACFGPSGKSLSDVSRVLVGEGILTKLCRKRPKQRQFFLFNDILVYGNIVINKRRYNKQNILALKNVRVEDIPDSDTAEVGTFNDDGETLHHGWLIISPTKTFAVYAQTALEKQEWMSHMSRCINDQREKSGIPDGNMLSAPAWVPDSEAHECMRCNKTKFSALQRRHHCRMCGFVVCNACSSRKCKIEHQSSRPLRVCDHCYESQTNTNTANPIGEEAVSSGSQFHPSVDSSDSDGDEIAL